MAIIDAEVPASDTDLLVRFAPRELSDSLEEACQPGRKLLGCSLTICSHVIAFSAAIPRQGGAHQVNEQWPSYWRERFGNQGFEQWDVIRPKIWDMEGIEPWYQQNLFLYTKRDSPCSRSLQQMLTPILSDFNVVHPGLFGQACGAGELDRHSGRVLLLAVMRKLLGRLSATRSNRRTR